MTNDWTIDRRGARSTAEPQRIVVLFPAAGRAVGRAPIEPETDPLGLRHGTVDDRARAELVGALLAALPPARAAPQLADLYRYGDDAERRGVLCGLNAAPDAAARVETVGLELVADALRTNDPRLVAAALGDVRRRPPRPARLAARRAQGALHGHPARRRRAASSTAPTPSSPAWPPRSSPNAAGRRADDGERRHDCAPLATITTTTPGG